MKRNHNLIAMVILVLSWMGSAQTSLATTESGSETAAGKKAEKATEGFAEGTYAVFDKAGSLVKADSVSSLPRERGQLDANAIAKEVCENPRPISPHCQVCQDKRIVCVRLPAGTGRTK